MEDLIKTFKKNEVLDALWYSKLFGIDISSVPPKDIFGPAGEILGMGQLLFGKYRIVLFYDKSKYGLHHSFPSDDSMREYIRSHTEEAFKEAVKEYKPYIYVLNIASVENFGAFVWDKSRELLERQLSIFLPIIQKFMVDALTDNFHIIEEDKLVKQ